MWRGVWKRWSWRIQISSSSKLQKPLLVLCMFWNPYIMLSIKISVLGPLISTHRAAGHQALSIGCSEDLLFKISHCVFHKIKTRWWVSDRISEWTIPLINHFLLPWVDPSSFNLTYKTFYRECLYLLQMLNWCKGKRIELVSRSAVEFVLKLHPASNGENKLKLNS